MPIQTLSQPQRHLWTTTEYNLTSNNKQGPNINIYNNNNNNNNIDNKINSFRNLRLTFIDQNQIKCDQ